MRVLALLAVLLALLGGDVRPAEAESVVEGRYVRVMGRVDGAWLEQAAELGDALFERLKTDFDRGPEARELPLQLFLYPHEKAFSRAVQTAQRSQKDASIGVHVGGWTSWDPCVSHVWLQADDFDTRRLILHELVHQFYARTRSKSRRGTGQPWYREGIAEWYGWHRRTKQGLAFGAFDVMTPNPRVSRVRETVAKAGWSAYAVGTGATGADYDDAIALVGALRGTKDETLRTLFARFEKDVMERGGGAKTFAAMFGSKRAELEAAVRAFWSRVRPPIDVVGSGWDEVPEGVRITPGPREVRASLGGTAAAWERIEVDFELQGASVGLLFSASDPIPSHRAPDEMLTRTHVAVTLRRNGKHVQLSVTRRRQPHGLPHPRGNAEGVSDELLAMQRVPMRGRCRLRVETTPKGIRVTVLRADQGIVQLVEAPPAAGDPKTWLAAPRLVSRAPGSGGTTRVFRVQRDDTVILPRPSDPK